VNFIGSINFGQWLDPRFDADTEAHTGFQSFEILQGASWSNEGRLSDWLMTQDPEVVCVMLGTNDVLHGKPVTDTLSNLSSIFQLLRTKHPGVVLLLGNLIPCANNPAGVIALNLSLPAFALLEGVELVDLNSGYLPAWNPDGIHPASEGCAAIASRWPLEKYLFLKSDVNRDGCVNDFDIAQVIFYFGGTDPRGDADRNGNVNDFDLVQVIHDFDRCRQE
jgi:hypothetical protein